MRVQVPVVAFEQVTLQLCPYDGTFFKWHWTLLKIIVSVKTFLVTSNGEQLIV